MEVVTATKGPICKYCKDVNPLLFRPTNKSCCKPCEALRYKVKRGTADINAPDIMRFCLNAGIDINNLPKPQPVTYIQPPVIVTQAPINVEEVTTGLDYLTRSVTDLYQNVDTIIDTTVQLKHQNIELYDKNRQLEIDYKKLSDKHIALETRLKNVEDTNELLRKYHNMMADSMKAYNGILQKHGLI